EWAGVLVAGPGGGLRELSGADRGKQGATWQMLQQRESHAERVAFFALAKEVDALIDGPRGVNLDQRTPTHDENHCATLLTRAVRVTLLKQLHGRASPGHRLN